MHEKKILIEKLQAVSDVPLDEAEKLAAITHLRQFTKGQPLIREGEKPDSMAFLVDGLFRYYYIDEQGNEYTKGFFTNRSFLSAYSALIQQRESWFTIEALADSTLLVFNYDEWQRLVHDKLCWQKLTLRLVEQGYCIKEARERELLLFDAEKRYRLFKERFPGLEERIKQHMVASYLGITPVALSRIRKKMGLVNTG
jgi:CRP-like cAMP-binding protein